MTEKPKLDFGMDLEEKMIFGALGVALCCGAYNGSDPQQQKTTQENHAKLEKLSNDGRKKLMDLNHAVTNFSNFSEADQQILSSLSQRGDVQQEAVDSGFTLHKLMGDLNPANVTTFTNRPVVGAVTQNLAAESNLTNAITGGKGK